MPSIGARCSHPVERLRALQPFEAASSALYGSTDRQSEPRSPTERVTSNAPRRPGRCGDPAVRRPHSIARRRREREAVSRRHAFRWFRAGTGGGARAARSPRPIMILQCVPLAPRPFDRLVDDSAAKWSIPSCKPALTRAACAASARQLCRCESSSRARLKFACVVRFPGMNRFSSVYALARRLSCRRNAERPGVNSRARPPAVSSLAEIERFCRA